MRNTVDKINHGIQKKDKNWDSRAAMNKEGTKRKEK